MVIDKRKEQIIVKQIMSGSTASMKDFYDIYSGYLTVVCARYISNHNDMQDVLQDSFIKIFKSISSFKYLGEGSLLAWSSRIVANESLKFIQKKAKLNITCCPSWELPDTAEEDADFEDVPTATIMEMIRALPIGYRTVFNLYVFENKSHKEIASILNISENTSASQLHRAKCLLAKQINDLKIR